MDFMNYLKNLVFIAVSIICFSLFISFSFIKISFADPPLPTPVGRVVWVKGDSFKASMENKEERSLQKQSVIYLHDMLATNASTTAEIILTDNTLITFQPNTKFSLDEYNYHPKNHPKNKGNSVGKVITKLMEGGFRTITGLISKHNPDDYHVKTPIATIGVRGTDYAVYLKDGKLYAAHYAGTTCITASTHALCIDEKNPYVRVNNANTAPEYVKQQPEGFKNKLEITQAKIDLFPSAGVPGTAGGAGGPGGAGGKNSGGTVNSFCIQ